MQQYSWSFDRDSEIWCNENHNTVEECLEDARASIIDEHELYEERGIDFPFEDSTAVYVGEVCEFVPSVDAMNVLEHVEDLASDQLGFIGQEWNAYDNKKSDEIEELEGSLTAVLHEWLRKYGRYPSMWSVDNVKQYRL